MKTASFKLSDDDNLMLQRISKAYKMNLSEALRFILKDHYSNNLNEIISLEKALPIGRKVRKFRNHKMTCQA